MTSAHRSPDTSPAKTPERVSTGGSGGWYPNPSSGCCGWGAQDRARTPATKARSSAREPRGRPPRRPPSPGTVGEPPGRPDAGADPVTTGRDGGAASPGPVSVSRGTAIASTARQPTASHTVRRERRRSTIRRPRPGPSADGRPGTRPSPTQPPTPVLSPLVCSSVTRALTSEHHDRVTTAVAARPEAQIACGSGPRDGVGEEVESELDLPLTGTACPQGLRDGAGVPWLGRAPHESPHQVGGQDVLYRHGVLLREFGEPGAGDLEAGGRGGVAVGPAVDRRWTVPGSAVQWELGLRQGPAAGDGAEPGADELAVGPAAEHGQLEESALVLRVGLHGVNVVVIRRSGPGAGGPQLVHVDTPRPE